MKKTLLILIILFLVVQGHSQTFTNNFITYQVINNQPPYTVQVTGYNFTNGGATVNIPSTATYNSISYSVTVIGDNAFQGNATTGAQISSVVIPNTVTYIGNNAFAYNLLQTLVIPNSVTSIGNLAFINNQINNLTLSNNLAYISTGVFQGNNISNITIPNSVTSIQANAFFNNQLTNITIPSNVILIGLRAFANNPLATVTCLGNTPPNVFYGNPNPIDDSISYNRSPINLYIPVGTTNAYLNAGWWGFNSVTESTLSASSFELENDVKIINTSNKIEIKHGNNINLKHYKIYSISGSKLAEGNENIIYTNTFSNGIYILELEFNAGKLTKKFAK